MNIRLDLKSAVLLFGVYVILASSAISMDNPRNIILLVPDPKFGHTIDWGYYFPTGMDQRIGFVEDGSFYIASSARSKILLFSSSGELLSEFGRSGQGPGDLTYPDDVTILDGQYVVVKESGMTRRISIFDLKGNFFKLFQTNAPLLSCIALGKGKIALVTGQLGQDSRKDTVSIRDIHSNLSIHVESFEYAIPPRSRIQVPNIIPMVHLARIAQDMLLVGFSADTNIRIYSADGKKLKEFPLSLPLQKITRNAMEDYLLRQADAERDINRRLRLKNTIKENLRAMVFPDFYPAYHQVSVDSHGNILIFDNGAWLEGSFVTFRTYSKDGKFVGEAQIDSGDYVPMYPKNFYGKWFYVSLRKREDNGITVITRVVYQK